MLVRIRVALAARARFLALCARLRHCGCSGRIDGAATADSSSGAAPVAPVAAMAVASSFFALPRGLLFFLALPRRLLLFFWRCRAGFSSFLRWPRGLSAGRGGATLAAGALRALVRKTLEKTLVRTTLVRKPLVRKTLVRKTLVPRKTLVREPLVGPSNAHLKGL